METVQVGVQQSSVGDVEIARAALNPLLDLLKSLPPPDEDRGREAAEIIERHLRPGVTLSAFWSLLAYDIGGKGLQDWYWSNTALKSMQPLLDAAYNAVRAEQLAEIESRKGT